MSSSDRSTTRTPSFVYFLLRRPVSAVELTLACCSLCDSPSHHARGRRHRRIRAVLPDGFAGQDLGGQARAGGLVELGVRTRGGARGWRRNQVRLVWLCAKATNAMKSLTLSHSLHTGLTRSGRCRRTVSLHQKGRTRRDELTFSPPSQTLSSPSSPLWPPSVSSSARWNGLVLPLNFQRSRCRRSGCRSF